MARNIVRFNPLAELDALQRQFFGDDSFSAFKGMSIPTTDVFTEDDKRMVVEVHLPNFDDEDIDISVDEGALVIQAQKRQKDEEKGKRYLVRESSTSFYRRIMLPERADEEHIEARFENGLLDVTIPFTEMPSPKKISIGAGSPAQQK